MADLNQTFDLKSKNYCLEALPQISRRKMAVTNFVLRWKVGGGVGSRPSFPSHAHYEPDRTGLYSHAVRCAMTHDCRRVAHTPSPSLATTSATQAHRRWTSSLDFARAAHVLSVLVCSGNLVSRSATCHNKLCMQLLPLRHLSHTPPQWLQLPVRCCWPICSLMAAPSHTV